MQCSYRISSIKVISRTKKLRMSASQALMKIFRFKMEIIKIATQAAYLQDDLQGS